MRIYKPIETDIRLPEIAFLIGVHYDLEGFRILLEEIETPPSFRRFRISFPSTPFAIRMIDEGDYLSTVRSGGGILARVENSEYLEWFNNESQNVREGQGLVHYTIYSQNECFDIIHSEPPKIEEM